MNKPVYTYSLLQYRHSQLLEEVLNVGLLAWFAHQRRLVFIYPRSLSRITSVYPRVQEKTVRNYLRSFSLRVANLNRQPEAFAHFDLEASFAQFIANELIPPDASALQFAQPRKGLLITDDVDALAKRLYNLYFTVYDTAANESFRIDDLQLGQRYKTLLRELQQDLGKELSPRATSRLYYDYEIRPNEGESFRFDIAWQNGSLNLVKPVSFDVARPDILQNKAFRYYGQYLELSDYAKKENLRFDLLLAKPKRPELFKPYDNALRLLRKPERVKLVFEENLREYTEQTVLALNEQDE